MRSLGCKETKRQQPTVENKVKTRGFNSVGGYKKAQYTLPTDLTLACHRSGQKSALLQALPSPKP